MSLNRREMLRLGAMGAAGAILSSAASSSVLPGVLTPPATDFGVRTPPSPFAAQNTAQPVTPAAPGSIDPQLFARAKAALDIARMIRI